MLFILPTFLSGHCPHAIAGRHRFLLRRNGGLILPTVLSVTAVVAFASGILDGVSMVGLPTHVAIIMMLRQRRGGVRTP
jgi:hypothetical protein